MKTFLFFVLTTFFGINESIAGEAPDDLALNDIRPGALFTFVKSISMPSLKGKGELLLKAHFDRNINTEFQGFEAAFSPRDSQRPFTLNTPMQGGSKKIEQAFAGQARVNKATCFLIRQNKKNPDDLGVDVIPKDRTVSVESATVDIVKFTTRESSSFSRDEEESSLRLIVRLKDSQNTLDSIQCLYSTDSFDRKKKEFFENPITVGDLKAMFPGLFSIDVQDQEVQQIRPEEAQRYKNHT